MTIAMTQNRAFFVLRATKGPQQVGRSWPAGATVEYRDDRYALIGDDGWFTVKKHMRYDEVLAEAQRIVGCEEERKAVTVAKVVGMFDNANLYEGGTLVYDTEKVDASKLATAAAKDENRASIDLTFKQVMNPGDDDESKPVKIKGMASTPDLDRDHDIVEPDAFKETIQAFLDNPVLLFNHNMYSAPIGVVEQIEFTEKGVEVVARIEDEQAKAWVRKGLLSMFSVTFMILDREYTEAKFDERGRLLAPAIRTIKKAELLEVSIVTIPSNRVARFEVLKSFGAARAKGILGLDACDLDRGMCVCDTPEQVVEHRTFKLADPADCFTLNEQKIAGRYGSEAWKLCHTAVGKSGPILPHSALVEDELRTVHDLLKLSMAQVLTREHDLSDEERSHAWSSLSKRWLDAELGEPPELKSQPDLRVYTPTLGAVGYKFATDRFDEASARRWATDRGLDVAKTHAGESIACYAPEQSERVRTLCVAPGIEALLPATSQAEGASKGAAVADPTEEDVDVKPEELRAAVTDVLREAGVIPADGKVTDGGGEGGGGSSSTQTDKGDEQSDEPVEISDDVEVELSPEHYRTLEAALAGEPVSAEELEAMVGGAEDALNAEFDIELEEAAD